MNTITSPRSQTVPATRGGVFSRLIMARLIRFLDRLDQGLIYGRIDVTLPGGVARTLGGRGAGPVAVVDLHRWRALLRVIQSGSIGWYQAWERDEWSSPDPVPFFDLISRNRATLGSLARAGGAARLWQRVAHLLRRNNRSGARRNIHAHYDLGNAFYAAWLDPTLSYSSALFARPMRDDETMEAAQRRKVDALTARLELTGPSDVLEVGCGWGHVAQHCASLGHRVTAITLSPSQKDYADGKCAAMPHPPRINLCDYRDVTGEYDAIISVEMVEAVGRDYWPAYLDSIVARLKPGGRAALQYIAIADDVFASYAAQVDFIQAYIFPGGMLVSETHFRALAEERGLSWENPVHFPLDYAETLRRWRISFEMAAQAGRLPEAFDADFIRLWRFYLMYCEGGFRGGGISVAQVTLVKPQAS
jgi:cyclopropane-fatty-acyl-phospholipid synthase